MAFGFSKTRVSPIAIDFGSERLKLLQLVPGDPPRLVAAAAAPVPEAAQGDPVARQQFFAGALRDLLKKQPFKGRRVICSLPSHQTLVQNFELSRNDHESLDSLVADQLRQRMNVDPGRMVIRHHSLGQVVRNGMTMQHVLCLAASRDQVMRYIRLCADCKLDLVGMHGEPIAILRAFADPDAENAEADAPAVCYIDIGASTTKLVIAHGSAIKFAKAIHVASAHLMPKAASAQAGAVDAAGGQRAGEGNSQAVEIAPPMNDGVDATDVMDATGVAMLNAAGQGGGAASPGEAPSQQEGDDETVEYLIDELQMCLRYYQSLFPKKPMQKLVFLGGGARQVQTCQRIARAMRVAAQLGDPLARLARVTASKTPFGVDLNEPQPGWTVPFGLCHSEANL